MWYILSFIAGALTAVIVETLFVCGLFIAKWREDRQDRVTTKQQ